MSKALAPLTYRQQALMVGYLSFGESIPFIASELERSVLAVELAYKHLIATFDGEDLITSPIRAPGSLPVPHKPSRKQKLAPRQFRVLKGAAFSAPDRPTDVTADLMRDPETAERERSFARPAKAPDPKHPRKWS